MYNIILTPSLQNKLKKPKFRSHAKLIQKLIKKIEEHGKGVLKILDVEDHYLLGEMKSMKPPYRLYVVINQKTDTYYIIDWEHKENQERAIGIMKEKLAIATKTGLDNIFG